MIINLVALVHNHQFIRELTSYKGVKYEVLNGGLMILCMTYRLMGIENFVKSLFEVKFTLNLIFFILIGCFTIYIDFYLEVLRLQKIQELDR